MVKLKPMIRGNTVYEVNPYSGKMRHITHGVDTYFRKKAAEENAEEAEELAYHNDMFDEEEEEEQVPSNIRRMQLLKLAGNKKKLVAKADGLKKEIAFDESEHEPPKKRTMYNRFRKKKSTKSKSKRKVTKCRCKK